MHARSGLLRKPDCTDNLRRDSEFYAGSLALIFSAVLALLLADPAICRGAGESFRDNFSRPSDAWRFGNAVRSDTAGGLRLSARRPESDPGWEGSQFGKPAHLHSHHSMEFSGDRKTNIACRLE